VILFAGKFEEKKAPEVLLQSFLKLGIPNTHLLFVGNGLLESGLKNRAKGHANIYFADTQNQSQMPAVYHCSDLFCLPSKGPGETWGLAVNEAMACGKAILVSDNVGCAIDLVTPQNGLIFKSADAEDLKKCLLHLLSDKRRLEKMGRASAEIIKSWNFDNIVLAIETQLNKTQQTP